MCWVWNLQGGWLSNLNFFDRGGSVVIFGMGGIGGLVGAIVVGPRYSRFMKKESEKKQITQGSATPKEQIEHLIALIKNDEIDADEQVLRKIRKLLNTDNVDNEFYTINPMFMMVGTILVSIGWAMLNAAGAGTNH